MADQAQGISSIARSIRPKLMQGFSSSKTLGLVLLLLSSFALTYMSFGEVSGFALNSSISNPSRKLKLTPLLPVDAQLISDCSKELKQNQTRVKYAIVVAHTKEDLQWLEEIPPEYKVYVVTNNLVEPEKYFKKMGRRYDIYNAPGSEAEKYLKFIIENYHNLPEKTLFIHGHKSSWHMEDIVQAIPIIPWNAYNYLALTNSPVDCWKSESSLIFDDKVWCHEQAAYYEHMWRRDIGRVLNMTLPPVVCAPCCSMFMVSATRVQTRPLQAYVQLYRSLLVRKVAPFWPGRIMEYVWHLLFGEPSQIGGLLIKQVKKGNTKTYEASVIAPFLLGPDITGDEARTSGRRGHGGDKYPCKIDFPAEDPEEDVLIQQDFRRRA